MCSILPATLPWGPSAQRLLPLPSPPPSAPLCTVVPTPTAPALPTRLRDWTFPRRGARDRGGGYGLKAYSTYTQSGTGETFRNRFPKRFPRTQTSQAQLYRKNGLMRDTGGQCLQCLPHQALRTVPECSSHLHFCALDSGTALPAAWAGCLTPGRQCHPPTEPPYWRGIAALERSMGAPCARTAGSTLPHMPVLFPTPAALRPPPASPSKPIPHVVCAPHFLPLPAACVAALFLQFSTAQLLLSSHCSLPAYVAWPLLGTRGSGWAFGWGGAWRRLAPLFGRAALGKEQRAGGGSSRAGGNVRTWADTSGWSSLGAGGRTGLGEGGVQLQRWSRRRWDAHAGQAALAC